MVFRVSETSSGMFCPKSPKCARAHRHTHTVNAQTVTEVLTDSPIALLLIEKEEELGNLSELCFA